MTVVPADMAKSVKRKIAPTEGGSPASSTSTAVTEVAKKKKSRPQQGLCVCSACGCKSCDKEWANRAAKKRTGTQEAVDDKCQQCWTTFQRGFASYMDWDRFCEFVDTPEAKGALGSVNKCLDGGKYDGTSSTVVDAIEVGIEVSRHVLLLSTSEFTKAMGGKPHSKMPKVPVIRVRREDDPSKTEATLGAH